MKPLRENEEFVEAVNLISNKCKEARVTLDEQLQLLGISEEEATERWLNRMSPKELPPKLKEALDFLGDYELLVIISNRVLKGEFDG